RDEGLRIVRGDLRRCRHSRGRPRAEAAIEHGDGLVTEPAQHPPESCRIHPDIIVVSDDLCVRADAPGAELRCERIGRRQWVPARRRRDRRRQIAIEVRVDRARNVRRRECRLAGARVREVEAAIDDPPARILEVGRERCHGNERLVHDRPMRRIVTRIVVLEGARKETESRDPPPGRLSSTIVRETTRGIGMALELWWGSGSPYSWRALLALEYKGLPYTSHLVQFAKQEHKSPQLLQMNPRGRVPVLKDGDYVVF